MNKETINEVGMWVLAILCVVLAAFFASKGNNQVAGGFGVGAGAILFFKFLLSL
jgi:hypothetical protein